MQVSVDFVDDDDASLLGEFLLWDVSVDSSQILVRQAEHGNNRQSALRRLLQRKWVRLISFGLNIDLEPRVVPPTNLRELERTIGKFGHRTLDQVKQGRFKTTSMVEVVEAQIVQKVDDETFV